MLLSPRNQIYYSKDKYLQADMSWPLEWSALSSMCDLVSGLQSTAHLHSNWISSAFLPVMQNHWRENHKNLQEPVILQAQIIITYPEYGVSLKLQPLHAICFRAEWIS